MEKKYIARWQSDLFRDQYRLATRVLLFLSVLALVLVCLIGWQILFKKIPQTYYASVTDGQIVPLKQELKSV